MLSKKFPSIINISHSSYYQLRSFSQTYTIWKKNNKKPGGKNTSNLSNDEIIQEIDPNEFLQRYKNNYLEVVNSFKSNSKKIRTGKFDPTIFDNLDINFDNKIFKFNELAQTILKGKNLFITLYDPKFKKSIIESIINNEKNLIPEIDPNNNQLLIIRLPSFTKEVKENLIKEIKKNHDIFKNSNQNKSLTSIRSKALKELKDFTKNDSIKKLTADIEKFYKDFAKELENELKDAENSVKKK
ncbi:hypothetical protein WICMUC_003733 [Wickerhamomyces mucosus]|uniref:Ribosome-recycling factor, mitochondrial n=1 Tax=Wickerhamomyces mucosus TaxID=1378264 RepID=A0A9P8PL52_9ASCO|nr:hypothetical protein WICMUC_003733 [Wickerhamomyces mucosus]